MATGQTAKKATRKVTAATRTAARGESRTAAAPAAEVEAEAVAAAVPRPSRARPAARAAAAMRAGAEPAAAPEAETTPQAKAEEQERPTAELTFLHRRVLVRLPTTEQLTIYRRLSKEFQDLTQGDAANHLSMDEALRHLDRATRLVQSVLASERDKEWIEDQLLEGRITLDQCTDLLREAFRLLNEKHEQQAAASGNRAARRGRARLAED